MAKAKTRENKVDIVALFSQIEGMKGVKKELIIEALKEGITAAYKKQYGQAQNVEVTYDETSGQFAVYSVREVVDEVFDSRLEISLHDARQLNELYEIGDKIRFQEELKNFARSSISVAKQNVVRKLREEEQNDILNEYKKYEQEMITGMVDRIDDKAIYIKLGRVDAMLMRFDQIFKEHYRIGDRISVYVSKVDLTPKGVRVYVSRTAPEMLKRLFEKEIPEVFDGTVEIVSVSREAGDRAKIVVRSHNEKVDAIGTMVGSRGSRIQPIINSLHGENMDIIEYSSDKGTLVRNVLKPATVNAVYVFDDGSALAVVPDDQFSLAIGKRGQNVRLAAQVAHCKIDIKKASEFDEADLEGLADAGSEGAPEIAEVNEAMAEEAETIEVEVPELTADEDDAADVEAEEAATAADETAATGDQVGLAELLEGMDLPEDVTEYDGEEEDE